MRWKIRQFIFDEKEQALHEKNADGIEKTVQLEPLLAEVLTYFCLNPDKTISRDELVDAVWEARAITDNAVNRVIAKLRKQLGDEPKSPQFIATYPKKGYRFIAPVSELVVESVVETAATGGEVQAKPHSSKSMMVFALFIIAAFAVMYLQQTTKPEPTVKGTEFLTRGGGQEFQPSVSPDGNQLLYTTFEDNFLQLYLKNLTTQETVKLSEAGAHHGPADWSDSGKYIAYLYTDQESCELRRLTLDGMKVTVQETIHYCPKNSYGKVIFTHDDNKLLYAEASEVGPPYSIYELTLPAGTSRRVSQPELILGGNTQFDLHPTEDKLLISSPDAEQWLAFFTLDLQRDKLTQMFRLNEYMCCAIWNLRGDRVIVIGEHPAYDLISFDLEGGDRQIIHSASHRISTPIRDDHTGGYVYVGGIYNRDIISLDRTDGSQELVAASSVDDRLVTLAPNGKMIAYMSDKSGQDEVWLQSLEDHQERKLTSGSSHTHYYDLKWSTDRKRLVGVTINELHVVDAETGERQKLDIPQTEIRGVSWFDANTLSYSIAVKGGWQVHYYDLPTNTVSIENRSWAYIRYASDMKNTLWFSETGALFSGEGREPTGLTLSNPIVGRKFAVEKQGDKLFYWQFENGKWAFYEHAVGGEKELLLQADGMPAFAVAGDKIYLSTLKSHSADIYRTVK
ncbi:winged helix-turn-helix domain-containing protein [Kordiimonas laminariae]|uniref:winged helix-turn-helix domain-containing protein n=1 Tax=Kordiimonas laminariae TaxID=2917717 RepID=UPI001FF38457|nr:winged helix-turn-helix domain-containing protein [Kordiimonas laminariae]MCK0068103.1 winged helix-turn-helix domain-containing protein [Kordiimonas laminariae]